MHEWHLQTAVAFFIFNRPDTTVRVFEAIRAAAPPRLFLVADGPRRDRAGEAERCAAVRDIVAAVDWPCEVLTNFSDENLGCRARVSSGLDWVFSLVEEAIILEDDCLPHPTFFRFCDELLERYRHDDGIMMISGDNFQFGRRRSGDSYYFSRYPHVWGWATWRRSWGRCYDETMRLWPEIRDGGWLGDYFRDKDTCRFWEMLYGETYSGKINAWSPVFAFGGVVNGCLSIVPAVNLISNIGFGGGATHTTGHCRLAEIPTEAMEFPLRHPSHRVRDARADRRTEKEQFTIPSVPVRAMRAAVYLCRRALGSIMSGKRAGRGGADGTGNRGL